MVSVGGHKKLTWEDVLSMHSAGHIRVEIPGGVENANEEQRRQAILSVEQQVLPPLKAALGLMNVGEEFWGNLARDLKDAKVPGWGVETVWKHVFDYTQKGWIVGSGSVDWGNNRGLVGRHGYSVLGAISFEDGARLVRLRNPWGRKEWDGPYSDGSELWTPEKKELAGWSDKNDGIFYMPIEVLFLQNSDSRSIVSFALLW